MMTIRDFEVWKAQVAAYLIKLSAQNPGMKREIERLLHRLKHLRRKGVGNFIIELNSLHSRYRLDMPMELLPTEGELTKWEEK